ncbi:hypothetical protein DEO72_LG8g2517 [Vigna unguiculata]|uniref:Uncharacterized protein n=1 Tax=Vigna unguiculata TaxID=3917 RepID=A0A4D6MV09_VIGUN|nr:hypothetical protein DEO72_LG8g2517 [Vigna unguiculata]
MVTGSRSRVVMVVAIRFRCCRLTVVLPLKVSSMVARVFCCHEHCRDEDNTNQISVKRCSCWSRWPWTALLVQG